MNASHSQSLLARVATFWAGQPVDPQLHLCLNRCRRARNGVCEDHSACREGMDCSDCGVRAYRLPSVGRSPRRRTAWRRWVSPAALTDISLCTLMTSDRVPSLHRLSSSWAHLMSVAYLAGPEFEREAAEGFRLLRLDGRAVPHAELLTLSVVEDRNYRKPHNRLPFNLLRNVAVAQAVSDLVCLVDVDFVIYPQPDPGCPSCHAAARLRRWLPLLRFTPNLALVLPAFDSAPTTPASSAPSPAGFRDGEMHTDEGRVLAEPMDGVRSKRDVATRVRRGLAEPFAFTQYPMGHACDDSKRWLRATEPYLMEYTFGCEPYLLYNRRSAPKLWEMFVAYGKDRVSFTYELIARGFAMVVQPDVFVIHHLTTHARSTTVASSVHARSVHARLVSAPSAPLQHTVSYGESYGHAPRVSGWQDLTQP